MKARLSLYLSAVVLLAILVGVGCSKAPTDAQIASDIQNKLNTDSGLQGKQLIVQADKGSVTLSGQVDNDAQRDAAARCAAIRRRRLGRAPRGWWPQSLCSKLLRQHGDGLRPRKIEGATDDISGCEWAAWASL